ncbi:MAG: DUF819 family protein [candidate division Zixibacteria bacterium]|nr:DUF819 family protein [candidate division Zixibacteria bacterium]
MNDSAPLITDWPTLLVIYTFIVGGIYFVKAKTPMGKMFNYIPPIIWVYFLPMLGTSIGLFPQASPLYDWVKRLLLPSSLVLLLLSVDLKSLARLGPKALGTMLFGTLGVVVGAPIALLIFKSWLPPDTWMGMGALSGSWIGGSSNMVAIKESIGTPEGIFGVMIVVDTVVGYGWMGIVMSLAVFQDRLDRHYGVDRQIIDDLNRRMEDFHQKSKRPTEFVDLAVIFAVGLAGGLISLRVGDWLPPIGEIISSFGWAIILSTFVGIGLSFTRISRLEAAGASHVGNLFLYLLLTTIGAQADLRAVLDAPLFLLVGVVWLFIHGAFLFLGGRLLKAPMFLIATGSQANIGGVVSAPIVASVYQPSLAPVGLLMGVAGNIVGLYAGLLCATLLSWVA